MLCLVAALTQGVESNLRFAAALAPLGLGFCRLLARWKWLFWPLLIAFAALDYAFTIGWIGQRAVLM